MISCSLPTVTIVREVKASPAKVWAAITRPEQMLQWWGPDAGPTLKAEADVRPGGRFSVVFRLLNGDEHNPTGIYQEVGNRHGNVNALGHRSTYNPKTKRYFAFADSCWIMISERRPRAALS